MLAFDHIAVAAATIADGAAHVEQALGQAPGPGGRHPQMGTHNLLLGLGAREYLEVIAVDPLASAPARPRWFDLDQREGPPRLSNWIARTDDLDAVLRRVPEAGRPLALARGELRWRMAVPDDGVLPFGGCFPAMIEWQTPPPTMPDAGLRLERLVLRHPDAETLASVLAALTTDPRIHVETGEISLEARIVTPNGLRTLA